ncbi:MAG: hypothetical protein RIS29_1423 [Bacteroidota bacterium]|jgi:hypothetical protein
MEDNDLLNESDFSVPTLYSPRTIRGFSIFFSPIFGGVLLMQNLLTTNQKKLAYYVLAGSIGYTILLSVLAYSLTLEYKLYGFNLLGGYILADIIQKRFLPKENKYYKKKIWKPLIISLLIILPFILLLFI